MVKANKKKDHILNQLSKEEQEEEFLESNVYLENEAINEEEEHFDERQFEEKNEQLIEKLRSIDGKKRRNLRTEIVQGELDVNISNIKKNKFIFKNKSHFIKKN
jgi:hypothetical protein